MSSKAYNHAYSGKSSHIGPRHVYVHPLIKDEAIIVDYVYTSENLVNPLIKGLVRDLVLRTSRDHIFDH